MEPNINFHNRHVLTTIRDIAKRDMTTTCKFHSHAQINFTFMEKKMGGTMSLKTSSWTMGREKNED
jgi:hypothetical protein